MRGPAVGKAFSSIGLFTGSIGGQGIEAMLLWFGLPILVLILFQSALNFWDDPAYNLHCISGLLPLSDLLSSLLFLEAFLY